jgi:DsbC/DsbD-like thiol-disulfide interchange protein
MRIVLISLVAAQLVTPAARPGHANVAASPAAVDGKPGAKVELFVEVTPKPGIHVYAPGNEDYIPITVKLTPQAEAKAGKLTYPKAETALIASEKVQVFQRPFRLTQEITVDKSAAPGSTVVVAGTVNYQACDDKVCFPPENAPVSWTVAVKP